MNKLWIIIPIVLIIIAGLGIVFFILGRSRIMDGDGMERKFTYTQIPQSQAKEMMDNDDSVIVVDVRREDEYKAGHIEGAILIPNESIDTTPPAELPDMDQKILVYCRSGRRSKEAAQKLADMGYSQVYEFGGIIDWGYGTVRDE